IVDGSLKVDIKENIDYTKAGKYEIMVSAKDKNNLETISKYQVVVKDKKVITTTTTNNQSNTNNNNNTDDYYEDNDYDSSYDNSNSNISHNSGSDNNSGGGSGKCRLPFKEDENGNCYAIAEEINFDNIYFDHDTWVDEYGVTHVFIRKYKDIHACIAAQDEIFDEIFNVYNNEYSGYFCDFNGDLWFYD
ncbi:MAG: hypothetical protein SPI53_01740, partial [Erysipelotrichaceae bacterium]|nr:hypothetical protein [Erysipelotrichaceae bacterium]